MFTGGAASDAWPSTGDSGTALDNLQAYWQQVRAAAWRLGAHAARGGRPPGGGPRAAGWCRRRHAVHGAGRGPARARLSRGARA